MKNVIEQVIEAIIKSGAIIKDHPKEGVNFLVIDHLLNDPTLRQAVSKTIISSFNSKLYDGVAPIASRGYILSGMIAGQCHNLGEYPIQKVKSKGDPRYAQLPTSTEYSSDELQLRKGTIKEGKNYLVIDDLIATGGSVNTAISLIKQCGGHVDTVLVLTELIDFGAREALKKEGIHLLSLLKFTNKDLTKLIHFQQSYKEWPMTPITFKLSHHQTEEKDLNQLKSDSPILTVHLASTSLIKKEALELALDGMFAPLLTKIVTHDSKSGVSEQPFEGETFLGATNRLEDLKKSVNDFDTAVLVSMENGIRYSNVDDKYYDFVHVIARKGGVVYEHTQDCCEIPIEIINAISVEKSLKFKETWGSAAQKRELTMLSSDPHQAQLFGGTSRKIHLYSAVCKVLGQLKTQMMEQSLVKHQEPTVMIDRFIKLNDDKLISEYSDMDILFDSDEEPISS